MGLTSLKPRVGSDLRNQSRSNKKSQYCIYLKEKQKLRFQMVNCLIGFNYVINMLNQDFRIHQNLKTIVVYIASKFVNGIIIS